MAFRREDIRAGSEMTQLRLSSYPHMSLVVPPGSRGRGSSGCLIPFQTRAVLGSQASPSPWVASPHVNDQTTQATNKNTTFSHCCCLVLGRGCETRCLQNNPEPTSCSHVVGMGSGLILSSPVVGCQIKSLRTTSGLWAAGWVMLGKQASLSLLLEEAVCQHLAHPCSC